MARALVRETAGLNKQDGPFNLALGRLLEREEAADRSARAEYPALWKKTDRKRVGDWLNS